MSFQSFKNDLSLKADQNKPEIMLVAGLVGVIGATILACRATLKAKDVMEEHNKRLEEIQENLNEEEKIELPVEAKRDIRKVYLKTS